MGKDDFTRGKYVIIIEGKSEAKYKAKKEVDNTQIYYDNALADINNLKKKLAKEKDAGMVASIKCSIACKEQNLQMFAKKLGIGNEV